MASEKTTKLELNVWKPTDNVSMAEFNENFQKIDSGIGEVTTQLAQTEEEAGLARASKMVISPNSERKAYMTIVDDDGSPDVLTKLKPLADELGIPITLAVIVESTYGGKSLTKEQLLSLQNDSGWEIASHSYTHPNLRTMTEEQIDWELRESKRVLSSWGLNVKNFVAPFGANDTPKVREIAAKYYNCTPLAGGVLNTKPVKNFQLQRYPIGSHMTKGVNDNLPYFKAEVDKTIAKNGWMILMTHVGDPAHDETQNKLLKDVILYAKSLNVEIVNLNDGFEKMGNMLEIEGVCSIDNTGNLHSKQINTQATMPGEITINTPPSYFVEKYPSKIAVSYFRYADNQTFPLTVPGTLITYALGGSDDIHQDWMPYQSNVVYKRRSANINGTAWSSFEPDSKVKITSANAYTNATLISDYEKDAILYTRITAVGNGGFPDVNGTLITNTLNKENGFYYQEFKSYNNNRIFERYVTLSGAWSAWNERAIKKTANAQSLVFGTIPAKSSIDLTVNSTTFKPFNAGSNIIINPVGAFPSGLICNAWVTDVSAGIITVRVSNFTDAPIVAGTLTFVLTHL